MGSTQLRLLLGRRLGWYFITEFLGVVNDNLFKNALIILVAYDSATSTKSAQLTVTMIPLIYLAPCFLFSAVAGQIADKFEKTRLIRLIKLYELGAMVLALVSLASGIVGLQLAVLFLLGTHSYFFAPVKYGIIPSLLGGEDLMAGNAIVEAGTFVGALIGTIAGGLLILADHGRIATSATLVVLAAAGLGASLFVPSVGRAAPGLRINPNPVGETWALLRYLHGNRTLLGGALGISWFYFYAAVFVVQLPNFAKSVHGADNKVVTLFLTLFSIGIGLGSLLCGWLLRGGTSLRTVPIGAAAMSLFALDVYLASPVPAVHAGPLIGVVEFAREPAHWRLLIDLLGLAISAGLFVVPLYVLLQSRSAHDHRSRVIAATNVQNAVFGVLSGLACAALLAAGASVPQLFLAAALANAAVALLALRFGRRLSDT